jgi:hypothetical protein
VKFRNSFGGPFVAITAASNLVMGSSHVAAAQSHAQSAEIRAVMAAQSRGTAVISTDSWKATPAPTRPNLFPAIEDHARLANRSRSLPEKYDSREKMGRLTFSGIKVTPLR